ncbi:Putative Molecular chaperone (ABC1) [Aspergillus calidoustus]|uniref:Putative Molecular chaperone (ABC1) n=1 Tax=Aspergillus calidoustus TaxID=454130 RepID=A0A0U5FUE5_ASPCI|nr:Putative Molecular chaperone (ABC1) [Aspergillus calidoustus]
MSGKRLLDAIQFLNVTKSVATKHLAVRQRQLDVFTRTSSLTKGIKSQTDGLILTARAAAELAKRFNDSSPDHTTGRSEPSPPTHADQFPTETQIPSSVTGASKDNRTGKLDVSPQQEEFYRPSGEQAAESAGTPRVIVPRATNEAQVALDKDIHADVFRSPVAAPSVAAGWIAISPQQEESYQPSPEPAVTPTGTPRVRIPQAISNTQVGIDKEIDADVYQAPVGTEKAATEPQHLSEDMMKDIFHSPRVARVLSRKPAADPRFRVEAKRREPQEVNPSIVEDIVTPASKIESEIASELKKEEEAYKMVESRVPSSRLGRIWQYGGLATSMAFGAVGEGFRRVTGSAEDAAGSLMFSPGNMERLVAKLSKMRGAALKLGQMISFQDSKMLPEPIQQVLQRVQDRADYMPAYQRDKVLTDNLGPNWRDLFSTFEEVPMAAASIGQVHGAVLQSTGQPVAVKIQYPGVADSIDSDLNNLSILLTASRLLPRGLYLDKTIANARTELGWECDYTREAECADRFRTLLADDPVFYVPAIIPEASGKNVITMERLNGVAVTKIQTFTQSQRNWIGTQILRLCLREITEFKYMQTDPNWTNFLYNAATSRLELLDFGATRAYPSQFIDKYVATLRAASRSDRDTCHTLSIDLGYLTGHESPAMVDAHVSSILTLAEPFMDSSPDVYDFSDQTITERVKEFIPVMIRERLAPPPEETYSLHRKLSGAFLLCARLGSQVRCKELFRDAMVKVDERSA